MKTGWHAPCNIGSVADARAEADRNEKIKKSNNKRKEFIMLPVMFKNSWFPTMFEDFLNSDIMPRTKPCLKIS